MRRRLLAAAVTTCAVAVVLPAAAAGPAPLRFNRPVDLPAAAGATEPSLVVDSRGRIYVSAIFGFPGNPTEPGTPVWRSTDGGRTYVKRATASAGPLATVLGGGDSALVLDKRDYVYATDLWLGDDSVSVSTDHGDSWLGGPVSHRMVGDRNWLAYSPGEDAIYQIWNGVDGLWVARADLGGPLGEKAALTFANNYKVASETVGVPGSYVRATSAWPVGIAVDPTGEGSVYASWSDQEGVAVARSEDRGATWTIGHVPGSRVTGDFHDTAWNYAPLAVDARGHVYAAWAQSVGSPNAPSRIAIHVAVSTDHGATWRQTVLASRRTAVFPTLALYGPGRVAVAWVDTTAAGNPNGSDFADAAWRLQYAEITGLGTSRQRVRQATVEPVVHEGTLFVGPQGGDRGMGDFFAMAIAPNGSAVVAYTRGSASRNQARVAVLPPHRA